MIRRSIVLCAGLSVLAAGCDDLYNSRQGEPSGGTSGSSSGSPSSGYSGGLGSTGAPTAQSPATGTPTPGPMMAGSGSTGTGTHDRDPSGSSAALDHEVPIAGGSTGTFGPNSGTANPSGTAGVGGSASAGGSARPGGSANPGGTTNPGASANAARTTGNGAMNGMGAAPDDATIEARIVEARCEREERCGRLGSAGSDFADRESCTSGADAQWSATEYTCSATESSGLDACLEAIRDAECATPDRRVAALRACRMEAVCG